MTDSTGANDDAYSPEEADRRRDDALRRALSTPAVPHEAMKVGKPKGDVDPDASGGGKSKRRRSSRHPA